MRIEKIDRSLFESFEAARPGFVRLRVIVKMSGVLDPDRVAFLRKLGAEGALEETVFVSTVLSEEAVCALSDQDWVLEVLSPINQTYHPDDPRTDKWGVK